MCVSVCKGYFRGGWNILGFFQLFVQVGGVGKYVSMCKACGKLGGVRGRALPGSFDFGPFIRHNLVESGTVFAQT